MKTRLHLKKTALSLTMAALLSCSAGYALADTTQPAANDLLNANLWMQNSVEYKANVRAIYALAHLRLDAALANKNATALPKLQKNNYASLPPAIILDCDETVIDNTAYESFLIKHNQSYGSKTWDAYVKDKVAKAMPGAVEFTQYAHQKGVKVFYITNRKKVLEPATYDNMQALGFPFDKGLDTLLTKGEKADWGSDKTSRDQYVANHYRVVLMLGDNLGDFTNASGTPEQRLTTYNNNKAHWGNDWLMLPNAEYGSFESAPFGGDYSLSAGERRAKKISVLNAWEPKK